MKALLHGFAHYSDFYGKDSRSLYWNFIVATHLICILFFLPGIVALLQYWRVLLEDPFIGQTIAMEVLCRGDMSCFAEEEFWAMVSEVSCDFWSSPWQKFPFAIVGGLLGVVWGVLVIVPTLSATARRLRDAGQNPWWVMGLIVAQGLPFLMGGLVMLVVMILCCLPTQAAKPGALPESPSC